MAHAVQRETLVAFGRYYSNKKSRLQWSAAPRGTRQSKQVQMMSNQWVRAEDYGVSDPVKAAKHASITRQRRQRIDIRICSPNNGRRWINRGSVSYHVMASQRFNVAVCKRHRSTLVVACDKTIGECAGLAEKLIGLHGVHLRFVRESIIQKGHSRRGVLDGAKLHRPSFQGKLGIHGRGKVDARKLRRRLSWKHGAGTVDQPCAVVEVLPDGL